MKRLLDQAILHGREEEPFNPMATFLYYFLGIQMPMSEGMFMSTDWLQREKLGDAYSMKSTLTT